VVPLPSPSTPPSQASAPAHLQHIPSTSNLHEPTHSRATAPPWHPAHSPAVAMPVSCTPRMLPLLPLLLLLLLLLPLTRAGRNSEPWKRPETAANRTAAQRLPPSRLRHSSSCLSPAAIPWPANCRPRRLKCRPSRGSWPVRYPAVSFPSQINVLIHRRAEFPQIRIDYFRPGPPAPSPLACFLSHVHSDHLQGLESLKSPFVYCSPATREVSELIGCYAPPLGAVHHQRRVFVVARITTRVVRERAPLHATPSLFALPLPSTACA
jgi:hypothetical protein